MKKLFALACVMVASVSMTARAGALPSETDYFHCPSAQTTPVGNVSLVADNLVPTWDTTAPAKSMTAGGGCGFVSTGVSSGLNYQSIYDLLAEGPFLGNLDSLTFRFYSFWVGPGNAGLLPYTVRFHVGVDAISMFGATTDTTGTSTGPDSGSVVVVPTATDIPGLYKFEFTVTGLNFVFDDSAEHDVQLTANVSNRVVTTAASRGTGAGWFPYDSTEASAAVVFNPETPAAVSVPAKTPNKG